MQRVKILYPDYNPLFTTTILVRISDVNYADHVGNDAILSIIHEARMQLLHRSGYTELNAGGNAMIMADVMIAYKAEAFYGDALTVKIYADDVTGSTFSLLYHISVQRGNKQTDIAHAKTGMVCFDYEKKKIAPMTDAFGSFLRRGNEN
jgi:acyl-CoA thioester hydrolase